MLKCPDQLLSIIGKYGKHPKTTDGKKVDIISAYSDHGDITKRFSVFLRHFWREKNDVHRHNGFDFRKYKKIFDSAILFCTYMLNEDHFNDHNITVKERRDGTYVDEKKMAMHNVDFDDYSDDDADINDIINDIKNENGFSLKT
jgi:hypothetical protein